jgi:hypothetical protein
MGWCNLDTDHLRTAYMRVTFAESRSDVQNEASKRAVEGQALSMRTFRCNRAEAGLCVSSELNDSAKSHSAKAIRFAASIILIAGQALVVQIES